MKNFLIIYVISVVIGAILLIVKDSLHEAIHAHYMTKFADRPVKIVIHSRFNFSKRNDWEKDSNHEIRVFYNKYTDEQIKKIAIMPYSIEALVEVVFLIAYSTISLFLAPECRVLTIVVTLLETIAIFIHFILINKDTESDFSIYRNPSLFRNKI